MMLLARQRRKRQEPISKSELRFINQCQAADWGGNASERQLELLKSNQVIKVTIQLAGPLIFHSQG